MSKSNKLAARTPGRERPAILVSKTRPADFSQAVAELHHVVRDILDDRSQLSVAQQEALADLVRDLNDIFEDEVSD